MLKRRLWRLLVLVTILSLSFVIASLPKMQSSQTKVEKLTTEYFSVCDGAVGNSALFAKAEVGLSQAGLGAELKPVQTPVVNQELKSSTWLRAKDPISAGVVTKQGVAGTWRNCQTPSTTGVLQVLNPGATELQVINTDDVDAVVDVLVWGSDGLLETPGSRGIVVAGNTQRMVPISVLTEVTTPVGIGVKTSSGRIAVVASEWTATSGEISEPAKPAITSYVTGIPDKAKGSQLLVTNPGNQRATIDVTAYGPKLSFQPDGAQQVVVEPESTKVVELTKSLNGERAGLRVKSDHPVVASVATTVTTDFALLTASVPAKQHAGLVPAGGTLLVTNPTEKPLQLDLTINVTKGQGIPPAKQTVPAGATYALVIPGKPEVGADISLAGDQEFIAAVTGQNVGVWSANLLGVSSDEAIAKQLRANPHLR